MMLPRAAGALLAGILVVSPPPLIARRLPSPVNNRLPSHGGKLFVLVGNSIDRQIVESRCKFREERAAYNLTTSSPGCKGCAKCIIHKPGKPVETWANVMLFGVSDCHLNTTVPGEKTDAVMRLRSSLSPLLDAHASQQKRFVVSLHSGLWDATATGRFGECSQGKTVPITPTLESFESGQWHQDAKWRLVRTVRELLASYPAAALVWHSLPFVCPHAHLASKMGTNTSFLARASWHGVRLACEERLPFADWRALSCERFRDRRDNQIDGLHWKSQAYDAFASTLTDSGSWVDACDPRSMLQEPCEARNCRLRHGW